MRHIILQNALGIETNCVIRPCSPGQAACSKFPWNPRELSFLHTQAHCFHSSASFTIFFLYLHLVMVPLPELLLLMSFFHFFLCLQKLFSLCSNVESEIWEWWHFYWRISWHPTSNCWLKVYGMVSFCIISSFLMISNCWRLAHGLEYHLVFELLYDSIEYLKVGWIFLSHSRNCFENNKKIATFNWKTRHHI